MLIYDDMMKISLMKTGRGRQARQGVHRWHSRPSAPLLLPGCVMHKRREGLGLPLVSGDDKGDSGGDDDDVEKDEDDNHQCLGCRSGSKARRRPR